MSVTFAAPELPFHFGRLASFGRLETSAAEFRQECGALDHLVDELYRDVERLSDELGHKGEEIDEARRRLAERGRQLAEHRKENGQLVQLLEQQETRGAAALAALQALREELASDRSAAREREAEQESRFEQRLSTSQAELNELRTERDQLRHDLALAKASAACPGDASENSLAPLLGELSSVGQQIHETQRQLSETRSELNQAIAHSAAANLQAAAHLEAAATAERAAPAGEANEQVRMLEQEQVLLEAELELVRSRAAELQETVHEQRRHIQEQQADVSDELKQLRQLVEQCSSLVAERPEPIAEPAMVSAKMRGSECAETSDPVVSSVMAQFARLQKDVAQRRKKK